MNEAELLAYMSESVSASDWNKRVEEVKRRCGGDYPPFWYATCIASGLSRRLAAEKWGRPELGDLRVEVLTPKDLTDMGIR